MATQNQPPGPYDPTPEDLDLARRSLARIADDSNANAEDLRAHAFGQIAGQLDVIGAGFDAEEAVRKARAALAAYDERKAAQRGAVES